jgi:protein SCO1/2
MLGAPGGVPERSKGRRCKRRGSAFAGSNPAPAIHSVRRPNIRPVTRLLTLLIALGCVAAAGCGGSSTTARTTASSSLAVKLRAPAQLRAATPDFALKDSLGRVVRLSQFRGKAVMLTFIYTHCPDVCPLIVGNLHTAVLRLGAAASKLQIIAVSVDPKGDTPATVKAFLTAHEMTGRMEYLIGSFKQLAPVWRSYGVEVQASPDQREKTVGHSAFVYGITGRGKALALYPPTLEPSWVVHDAPILAAQ